MKIELERGVDVYRFSGNLNYLIVRNRNAGKKNVYEVYILNAEDPLTVGRELPIAEVKGLIKDYEKHAPTYWLGDRGSLNVLLRRVGSFRFLRSEKAKRDKKRKD
jgi:hypothetical protein